MNQAGDSVIEFFRAYEENMRQGDDEALAAQYGEAFMFAGPSGVQAIRREDFRKALSGRKGFFDRVGLKATGLASLEETRLDDRYVMVKATWVMSFVPSNQKAGEPENPVDDENYAPYVLSRQDNSLHIVFQLDHQDLMKKAQELGFGYPLL